MKERANDERFNQAVVEGDSVTFRGQRFKLGRAKKGTVVPTTGPNTVKALRLRLEELE